MPLTLSSLLYKRCSLTLLVQSLFLPLSSPLSLTVQALVVDAEFQSRVSVPLLTLFSAEGGVEISSRLMVRSALSPLLLSAHSQQRHAPQFLQGIADGRLAELMDINEDLVLLFFLFLSTSFSSLFLSPLFLVLSSLPFPLSPFPSPSEINKSHSLQVKTYPSGATLLTALRSQASLLAELQAGHVPSPSLSFVPYNPPNVEKTHLTEEEEASQAFFSPRLPSRVGSKGEGFPSLPSIPSPLSNSPPSRVSPSPPSSPPGVGGKWSDVRPAVGASRSGSNEGTAEGGTSSVDDFAPLQRHSSVDTRARSRINRLFSLSLRPTPPHPRSGSGPSLTGRSPSPGHSRNPSTPLQKSTYSSRPISLSPSSLPLASTSPGTPSLGPKDGEEMQRSPRSVGAAAGGKKVTSKDRNGDIAFGSPSKSRVKSMGGSSSSINSSSRTHLAPPVRNSSFHPRRRWIRRSLTLSDVPPPSSSSLPTYESLDAPSAFKLRRSSSGSLLPLSSRPPPPEAHTSGESNRGSEESSFSGEGGGVDRGVGDSGERRGFGRGRIPVGRPSAHAIAPRSSSASNPSRASVFSNPIPIAGIHSASTDSLSASPSSSSSSLSGPLPLPRRSALLSRRTPPSTPSPVLSPHSSLSYRERYSRVRATSSVAVSYNFTQPREAMEGIGVGDEGGGRGSDHGTSTESSSGSLLSFLLSLYLSLRSQLNQGAIADSDSSAPSLYCLA